MTPGTREEARQQRREEARRQREALVRRRRRKRLLRRGLVWGAVLVLVGLGVFAFVRNQQAKNKVKAEAARVASAAGCTQIESKPDLGATHLSPGQTQDYKQHPATSGPHAGPLPADQHVYFQPVEETSAVHNLEHGYVLLYYRQEGDQKLPDDVVNALEQLADGERKVIMAPYTQLEAGNSLAFVAWNKLQQCPSAINASQATTLARSFISLFRGGGDAPEPAAP